MIAAAAVALIAGGGGPAAAATGQESEAPAAVAPLPYRVGGPFSLIDHTGQPQSDADFRGEYLILYFGYTACPNTCSTALAFIAGALDALGDEGDRVRPLFITVDPEYDTLDRLAAFVGRIHPRLMGLTGDPRELARLRAAYRIEAREVEDKGGFERLVDHTPVSYLVGPGGRVLTLFPPIIPPARLAGLIRRYLR